MLQAAADEAEPAKAQHGADLSGCAPEEPDCLAEIVRFLKNEPPEMILANLPSSGKGKGRGKGKGKSKSRKRGASSEPAPAASFKVSRRAVPITQYFPIPSDMPRAALPAPGTTRGAYNYTVRGTVRGDGDDAAVINVQLRSKAFYIVRCAGGYQKQVEL